MKKHFIISILILSVSLSGCSLFKKKNTSSEPETKEPINEPVNVIDLQDRPFISLVPRSDGKEVTLSIASLPKDAQEMEYELEYQAGTLLQGAFGSIDFEKNPVPTSVKTLLGSCSAGGACSFHEDVKGGTLILKFRGTENYVLKTEWRFQATKEAAGLFSSRDAKFQLDAGKALDSHGFVIIMQTSGLPQPVDSEVIAGPYGISTSDDLPDKTAVLTLRLSDSADTATIKGWDGESWEDFDTIVKDKSATATVDLLPVFIAVK